MFPHYSHPHQKVYAIVAQSSNVDICPLTNLIGKLHVSVEQSKYKNKEFNRDESNLLPLKMSPKKKKVQGSCFQSYAGHKDNASRTQCRTA